MHDLIFVGGGFRTTTFLASRPELLARDTVVIERASRWGAGAFDDLDAVSSSNGSGFFRHIDHDGAFAWALDDPVIGPVARADQPVGLKDVSCALSRLAEAVGDALGAPGVRLGRQVTRIDVDSASGAPVTVTLDNGETLHALICVLGTGRHEVLHSDLAPWSRKVWPSADILSITRRAELEGLLQEHAGGRIVIAGNSHSAFSALRVLLDLCSAHRSRTPPYRPPSIDIVHRRRARLAYPDLAQARQEQVPAREELAREAQDVCPKTGIVFRDSGLRHQSRSLFLDVWSGRLPTVRLHQASGLVDCAGLFEAADLVVQALGYEGQIPEIRVDENLAHGPGQNRPLEPGADGFLHLGRVRLSPLAAIRVEPTPPHLRDHHQYAVDLYERLGAALTQRLSESAMIWDRRAVIEKTK
ncbi:MAG: hypothetical protein Q8Q88_01205 [Phenylobacterium sp.]|uniref:hypothetical protein n=1 Tax=Phenylobacterium sp. TaxID=1871053 RepID=UPI00273685EF|nr:hypothetical protein [Phenylobacterium sp.]MDP3745642.1 hypothetical protein [Phenylobacterium sp.]